MILSLWQTLGPHAVYSQPSRNASRVTGIEVLTKNPSDKTYLRPHSKPRRTGWAWESLGSSEQLETGSPILAWLMLWSYNIKTLCWLVCCHPLWNQHCLVSYNDFVATIQQKVWLTKRGISCLSASVEGSDGWSMSIARAIAQGTLIVTEEFTQ